MVRPAPAIIGQPCAGGADEHMGRTRQMGCAADQDQVVFLDPVDIAFGGQGDQVATGAPALGHGKALAFRPVAAVTEQSAGVS